LDPCFQAKRLWKDWHTLNLRVRQLKSRDEGERALAMFVGIYCRSLDSRNALPPSHEPEFNSDSLARPPIKSLERRTKFFRSVQSDRLPLNLVVRPHPPLPMAYTNLPIPSK
jgi:hypothetical protein